MDAFNTEALKLTVMGVTVTVSSGDDGVASSASLCNANSGSIVSDWPVSRPNSQCSYAKAVT
jgi:hypothetical protein